MLQEGGKRLLNRVFHSGIKISKKCDHFQQSQPVFLLDFRSGYIKGEPPILNSDIFFLWFRGETIYCWPYACLHSTEGPMHVALVSGRADSPMFPGPYSAWGGWLRALAIDSTRSCDFLILNLQIFAPGALRCG